MAPPDPIGLDCPECGAANWAGETTCFLCGHGLDTARPETRTGAPKSPALPTSPELVNPYAPPTTFVSPALTFRISSLLMVIAVIAVCLGVARENLFLGIFLAVVVAPALMYTVIAAARSRASGMPRAVFEKVSTFFAALVGVVVIEVSALIAFCMTCVPVGYATLAAGYWAIAGNVRNEWGLIFALATGGAAGVAAAAYMTYRLLHRKGRRWGNPGKP